MKKRWLVLGLASVLMLGACGNGETEGGSGDQVEIRFSWWGDTGRNEIYEEIVDRFEEENPDIRVMREFGGWNDYWTRLTTQVGGGNAPDVMSMHQFYVSDYANRGALLPLDDYVEDGTIDQSLFEEPVIESGRVGDDLFMISKGVTMPGYVYSPALFEEHGVEQPEDGWTYEDLQRIGEEFTAATDGEIRATADYSGGQLQPNFAYYVRQTGYDLFTEEGTLGFEAGVLTDWWTMWSEWREADLIPDAALSSELANATLEENFFATGQTAMVQVPANQLHLYQDLFEDELEIIAMPGLSDGEPGEIIEGAYLTISESSNHPEEAARFIDFFVNTEEALEVFLVEQGAPGNNEMSEYVQEQLDEANTKAVEFVNRIVPEAEEAPFAPEGISELENIFGEHAESVAFGNVTPEEAAEQFMTQAEELGFVE